MDDPALVHAITECRTEELIQYARAAAETGIHAIRINEYPAGAELISEQHFTQFVLPYLKQLVRRLEKRARDKTGPARNRPA